MAATITLLDERRSLEDLHRLALDLRRTLEREAPVEARLLEDGPADGMRGDAVSAGVLVLTFLSSGAAVALFEVLRTLFERDRDLRVELGRKDGAKLAIDAHNMDPREIERSMQLAREFFEGSS